MNVRSQFARPFGRSRVAALTVLALALFAEKARAAEPTSTTLEAAHSMIMGTGTNTGNDKLVLGFAYPTANRLSGIDYLSKSTDPDGSFTLTYQYRYKDSDNDPAHFQMKFSFSATGKITGARPLPGKYSSFWEPMSSAEIGLELMKEVIRADPKKRNDPVLKHVLALNSPTDVMIYFMNVKAAK